VSRKPDAIAAESPAGRLARWAERDAAIGLAAEIDQLRAQLAERDRELANLHERADRLAQHVAQLTMERDRIQHRAQQLERPSFAGRAYRKLRRIAGRLLKG
jgi:uncharacterized coiled-coil DUF342 family protein